MANTFLRRYELTIGNNAEIKESILPRFVGEYQERKKIVRINGVVTSTEQSLLNPIFLDSYKDFNTFPPRSLTITDLQIEADVLDNKNVESQSSQRTTIKIYNLSEKSRNFIKSGDSVFLKAGYVKDKELPLIYVGQIINVESKKDGKGNVVTEIFSNPYDLVNNIKIAKSYPPGSSLGDIVKDLVAIAASKGIPTGEIIQDQPSIGIFNRLFPTGYTVKGNLLDCLSKVCSENYLRSYIVLGRLYVQSKLAVSYIQSFQIGKKHLLSTVEKEDDKAGKEILSDNPLTGIKFDLILNGNITTNTLVRINFSPYVGQYIVKSVNHKLNYEGQDWTTTVHCEKLKT